ncbi:MAG: hypothetical protein LUE92_10690 [Clostridiales bacterium]|nr:hypothetical protein [Clostridiales bacterium]
MQHKAFKPVIYILWLAFWFIFYYKQCVIDNTGDYYAHNLMAELMKTGEQSIIYPLYHYAVIMISVVFSVTTQFAGAVVLGLSQLATLILTEKLISYIVYGQTRICDRYKAFICMAAAMLVNVVQPIFTYSIRPGYSSGNGYISPTQAFVKPFIILVVLLTWQYICGEKTLKKQTGIATALFLSCLAKPVFAMAFIPAMGIYYLVVRVKELDVLHHANAFGRLIINVLKDIWPLIISGIVIIAQYAFSRTVTDQPVLSGIDGSSSVAIGWMKAWNLCVSNVWLSILFAYFAPIVFLLVNRRKLKFMTFWKMTGIYALVSFLYISCLYQTGKQIGDLNFRNCWIIVFTLTYTGCFSEMIRMDKDKKTWATIALFGIHLLFGLALLVKDLL